ncbi:MULTISPECIES: TIGR01620 family protein [unclassified Ensifer]|uniref:YcjF family protein n=1 Tax=unclassified Ensifer TaxID=2633371 RepID=UPI00081397B2|nr:MULTISPECIES: TIGR01620 family protein [unclassified Ensifer]OCP03450.1 TIGR01620 family protein [Ensifer sp. LC11]OCP03751.1 TIGR01620 family protein [Ensifer sp. LC13]OCP08449.1 TIGR01620 family protein [Ensifer sp. LC14]OCP30220.1 TIGR01620 family protein [Ensifer sp. LC499]
MSDDTNGRGRRPGAFSVQEDKANQQAATPPARRAPASFDDNVVMTPDTDDPFRETTLAVEALALPEASPRKRRLSFGKIAIGALGIVLSLAAGLWVDQLLRDLFSRADWLGYTALAVVAIGLLALLIVVARELSGMMQLTAIQKLKAETDSAAVSANSKPARAAQAKLVHLLAANPKTARGRARLKESDGEIIDGPHLIELTERELLSPLDREARRLILTASKRVSIVTAVSPRALVDLGYVLYESARLIRAMAELYGGRPGTVGLLRLMRDVIAHLAVTGSIAAGDSLIQQVLGHGLASKLSARLGEGVINGLMTARIGIAAMDLCRPMPFRALKRPGIGDFLSDLSPGAARTIGEDGEK